MFSFKNNFFISFFFALTLFPGLISATEILPSLNLTYPKEGQVLIKGHQYKITWEIDGNFSGNAVVDLIYKTNNNFSGKTCNLGYAPLSQKQFTFYLDDFKNCQDFLKDKENYVLTLRYSGYYAPVGRYIDLMAQKNIIVRLDTKDICGSAMGQSFSQVPESGLCNYGEVTSPLSVYDDNVFDGNWHWACENVKCSAIDPNQEIKKSFKAWQVISSTGEASNPATIEYVAEGPCSTFSVPAGYILSSCETGDFNQFFGAGMIKVILKKGVACTQNYAPVCGKNNKTYPNECFAKRENAEIAYNGSCSLKVDGVCGSANGQITSERPSVNLCQSGLALAVSKYAPWAWSCKGVNGGADVQCSAGEPKKIEPKSNAPIKPLNEMTRAELLMYLLKLLAALQAKQ